jgi:hypothetical protein
MNSTVREEWSAPPAQGELVDEKRYRLTWWPRETVTKKAIFKLGEPHRGAELLFIQTIKVQQRGPTDSELDDGAGLEEIPDPLLGMMESHGVAPCEPAGEDQVQVSEYVETGES